MMVASGLTCPVNGIRFFLMYLSDHGEKADKLPEAKIKRRERTAGWVARRGDQVRGDGQALWNSENAAVR